MKEILSAVILLVSLLGGTALLSKIHDSARKAALEKASKGLPSLTELNRSLGVNPHQAK